MFIVCNPLATELEGYGLSICMEFTSESISLAELCVVEFGIAPLVEL